MIRSEIDSLPTELDSIRRKLFTLETEREALLKEEDDKSKARLIDIQREIAELKMPDLNAASVEAAMSMVAGTARSMGIVVED